MRCLSPWSLGGLPAGRQLPLALQPAHQSLDVLQFVEGFLQGTFGRGGRGAMGFVHVGDGAGLTAAARLGALGAGVEAGGEAGGEQVGAGWDADRELVGAEAQAGAAARLSSAWTAALPAGGRHGVTQQLHNVRYLGLVWK